MAYSDMMGGVPSEQPNAFIQGQNEGLATMHSALANQQQQALIDQHAAQLPGQQAQSGITQLTLARDQAAQANHIRDAAQASNLKYKANQNSEVEIGAHAMRQLSERLKTLDPSAMAAPGVPAYHAAIDNFATQHQFTDQEKQDPMWQRLYQLPPDQVPQMLEKYSDAISGANPTNHAANVLADKKITEAKYQADLMSDDRRYASDNLLEGKRIQAASKRLEGAAKAMSPDQRFTFLNSLTDEELTPAMAVEKNRLVRYVQAKGGANSPEQLKATLMDADGPQQHGQAIADSIAPIKPTAPASNGQVTPDAIIKKFGANEPDKWEYAIVRGVLARRLLK